MRDPCLITFNIGSYSANALFDVFPMDAYHVLLGRLWKYYRRVMHDGTKKTYQFDKDGEKFKLQPLNEEVEKEGKVMILSYVKGVKQQEDMQELVEGNKEKIVGAIAKAHSEEKYMGVYHSHNDLCGFMFTSDLVDGGVEKEKSGLLVKMVQPTTKMLPKEDNKTVNVVGVTEKQEMFKGGVDVEYCWVSVLK